MSTTQLVVASKEGDNEAFGRLLEQYRGFLLMLAHRYLSARLRRRVDPTDIVQTTFLEARFAVIRQPSLLDGCGGC